MDSGTQSRLRRLYIGELPWMTMLVGRVCDSEFLRSLRPHGVPHVGLEHPTSALVCGVRFLQCGYGVTEVSPWLSIIWYLRTVGCTAGSNGGLIAPNHYFGTLQLLQSRYPGFRSSASARTRGQSGEQKSYCGPVTAMNAPEMKGSNLR